MHSIRIIGPGRAGTSLAAALSARGWEFAGFLRRGDDLSGAARGVDVLVIATPDDAIAEVAAAVVPVVTTTVVHLSGSLGLDALGAHPLPGRRAPARAAAQRRGRRRPAVLGRHLRRGRGAVAHEMVAALGGRTVEVADEDRAAYHAAACIAANHVVALLGQVERVAAEVGLDLESFLPLTRAAVDDVAALGAQAALTGPGAPGRLGHAQPAPRCAARVRARRLPGRCGPGHQARRSHRPPPPAPTPARRRDRVRPGDGLKRGAEETEGHGHGRHRDRRRLSRPPRRGPRHRAQRRPRADHGRAARRAHLAHRAGPRRSATSSPSASSSTRCSSATPRTSPATRARSSATSRCAPRRAPTSSSSPPSARCTRRGPTPRRPPCRCAASATPGRAPRARATSTASRPSWPSCSPSPAPAGPTSASRTSNSSPSCAA